MSEDAGQGMGGLQAQAQVQTTDVAQMLEMMKNRRDAHIASAEKITRLLDYVEAHPAECQEMLKLLREAN
jgi:hypothetical protein